MSNSFFSDAQVIDWLQLLAPSNRERREIVKDFFVCPECLRKKVRDVPQMCQHRTGDRMSPEDQRIALRGLRLLDEPGRVPEAAGPRIIFREDLIEV